MINSLTEEIQNKLIKLKDKWIEDVILQHTYVEDAEQFKSMPMEELQNLQAECEIDFSYDVDKYVVHKGSKCIAEYSRKYEVEELEDGLKIKIKSWID